MRIGRFQVRVLVAPNSDIKFVMKITESKGWFLGGKYEKQEMSFSSLVESSSIDRIVKRYTVRTSIENKTFSRFGNSKHSVIFTTWPQVNHGPRRSFPLLSLQAAC